MVINNNPNDLHSKEDKCSIWFLYGNLLLKRGKVLSPSVISERIVSNYRLLMSRESEDGTPYLE